MKPASDDPSKLSMLELFRVEAETHTAALTNGLLALERGETTAAQLESLMRAAHSLKGAARIINLSPAVRVANAMEEVFVAAQQGLGQLQPRQIDTLLLGVDLLTQIAKCSEASLAEWEREQAPTIELFMSAIAGLLPGKVPSLESGGSRRESRLQTPDTGRDPQPAEPVDRAVRLDAENLNRLLGLAAESLVVSRWLRPFSDSMQRLRRMQTELEESLERLRSSLDAQLLPPQSAARVTELFQRAADTRQFLAERLEELDHFDRRSAHLSSRLYGEVLRTRMRPFRDGVQGFPRMVRDLSRSLGKQARLEIIGADTPVDRDILERLEAPLTHLLRNAVDHGCEQPEARIAAGKPPEALIQLEARHSAGFLLVSVSDDGAGLDTQGLRRNLVEKQLTTESQAAKLGEVELLEFLFLPGFTLKDQVTEISGRGVGLDVVRDMVRNVRGQIRVETQPGRGTRFQLQLPLTLSVLRALLVEVAEEPYAIPLAQITRALKLPRSKIETLAGRPHFALGDQRIGLVTARQAFGGDPPTSDGSDLSIVVLGDPNRHYGLVVDRFLGERELVVRPLDPRLGKVPAISAAALLEDGAPVLIVDVDDLARAVGERPATDSVAAI